MPEAVDDRIDYIADLMGNLQWRRGKTGKLIAKAWGLSLKSIEAYATTASRLVIANADDARRDISAGCQTLMRSALENEDARSFGQVGKLLADVSGANAPAKHQLSGPDGGPVVVADPESAARLVRESFGEHAMPYDDDEETDATGDTGAEAADTLPPGAPTE